MRKSILYILLSLVLAVSCTDDIIEPSGELDGNKVLIDLSVQIHDPSVATKALAQKPTLRNLMVAVFDASGYLLEYTFATEIDLATENSTLYAYKVAVTQSDEPRIIHFIGNAPEKLRFGVEETVLADITSSIGENPDDGIYWCRREVPQISGTQSGGAMLLDEGGTSPNYQADEQTRAYFSNVGLIRNFSQIQLVSGTGDFTLEKYYVVGTPKEGLASAYNYSTGQFVNYYKDITISGNAETGYTVNYGEAKKFAEIIAEGYDANVLPTAQKFTLAESAIEKNWISEGASAYVYECEKPLKAEDAVYIIAYGEYSDGKNYYYKIDLRDENGYFPIIRNFMYKINIKEVTRAGYETIEKAATSAGSGDISTSLETKSLAYISDGEASLEVEYIEKYIVTPGDVTLEYEFLDNVQNNNPGEPEKMWIVVNEAGATGAAIAKINDSDFTVGNNITVSQNPGTLTITPTALTDVPKSQTLTIFAEYVNDGASHILQRTVNFIVQSKRTMLVSLTPSEVPNEAGSEFDVKISLPAGLSKSIFPLEFLIESGALSINPHNDQMPVRSGLSLVDNKKSSFYFVKTFEYDDYNSESGAINIVDCHFKTIKAQAETHIYAVNPYFITEYDYLGTVSNLDADGKSVYLDTYAPSKFSSLSFSSDPVGAGENQQVSFSFNMDRIPEDGVVRVALGNLMPASDETQLKYIGNEGTKAIYEFRPSYTSGTFRLQTAHFYENLSVDLSAYKFTPASKSAGRELFNFNGSFSPETIPGLATPVSYTFFVPYYYEGMVIEVELTGLKFNEGKPPVDWENWRDLGNNVYAVQYKPSGSLNAVTINLLPTITTTNQACSITLQSQGYYTQTSTLKVVRDITIPARKLITSLGDWWESFSENGTISIYKNDNTLITNYSYQREETFWGVYGRAYNTNAITLTGVSNGDVYTIKYGNYTGTFTITDNIETDGVTVTLR